MVDQDLLKTGEQTPSSSSSSSPSTTSSPSYLDEIFPGPRQITIQDFLENDGKTPKKRIPYFLNPFALENAAIISGSFNIGLASHFLSTPVTFYLIETLDISATQYSAYHALKSIPWSLKFVWGMLSDQVPILNYRRKSWFFLGWLGFVIVSFALAFMNSPDADAIIGLMVLNAVLYLIADVAADTMIIERVRWEKEILKGSVQTSYYMIRSFGGLLGAVMGALLYNTSTWGWGLTINQCFLLSALLPLITIMPPFVPLEELISHKVVPVMTDQFAMLWETVQLRAVWQTVGYIYFYGIFQVPNSAMTTFLIDGLGFTDFEYGMLSVAGHIISWVSFVLYRSCFFDASWRAIYIYCTIIGVSFQLLNIVLILRLNVDAGIPDFYFALGEKIANLLGAVSSMPAVIMFAMLCPPGSEGLVYAGLTTVANLADTVAADIGSACTLIWDVSNATISGGDFTGVLNLAILTTCLSVVPLCMVWVLPDSKEDLRQLRDARETSVVGGAVLLAVVLVSLVATIIVSIVLIWA